MLLHEGGRTSTAGNGTGAGADRINDCANPTGAIPPIVDAMDDEIDVVVTGHTNWAVNCVLDGKIVTGAGANGRIVTDIDLTLSPGDEGRRRGEGQQRAGVRGRSRRPPT